ncbi:alpha carbonic anhydrase [Rhizophagus diaphanus]|nr:alpha carbonic anhydrase [Rhizophagus diaphanus] [Rhizophagus sp. MUCL 43196]
MLMKSFLIPTIVFSLILVSSNFAAEDFDYDERGPEHWGQQCKDGIRQSPINFNKNDHVTPLPHVNIKQSTPNVNSPTISMEKDGHATMFLPQQLKSSSFDSANYIFDNVHFHTPSEHRFNGIHTDLEAHFVFKDSAANKYSVIGVLYQVDCAVGNSNFFGSIINLYNQAPNAVPVDINSEVFLHIKEAYKYYGSLTIPPCNETVTWWVVNKPLSISASQLVELRKHIGFNSRPTQPRKGRTVPPVEKK